MQVLYFGEITVNSIISKTLFLVFSLLSATSSITAHQTQELPIEVFSTTDDVSDMILSPDGLNIAFKTIIKDKDVVVIQNLKTGESKPLQAKKFMYIHDFKWANNETLLVLNRRNTKGSKRGFDTLYAFNTTTDKFETVLKPRAGSKAPPRGQDGFMSIMPNEPNKILMSISYFGEGSGIYEVDLTNGSKTMRASEGRGIASVILDTSGTSREASGMVEVNSQTYFADDFTSEKYKSLRTYRHSPDGKKWQDSPEARKNFIVNAYDVGFLNDNKSLIATGSYRNGQSEAFIFDPSSANNAKPFKEDNFKDVSDILYDSYTEKHIGFRNFNTDAPDYYTDPEYARAQKITASQIRGATIKIINKAKNKPLFLIAVNNDRFFGAYFLLNTKTKQIKPLATVRANAKPNLMSATQKVTIEARDGMKLYGSLTLPKSTNKTPLIIWANSVTGRVDSSANTMVQFLANQGYAVLRTSQRGALYSQQYHEAGLNEFVGKIAEDINDFTNWSASLKTIDTNNICILGKGYEAGYLAMQAYMRAPELYKCIININGAVRMPYYNKNLLIPSNNLKGFTMRRHLYGQNMEKFKRWSPINHPSVFKAPILLIAPNQSRSTKIKHYMTQLGNNVDDSTIVELEHNEFPQVENHIHRKVIYTEIQKFLKEHISK